MHSQRAFANGSLSTIIMWLSSIRPKLVRIWIENMCLECVYTVQWCNTYSTLSATQIWFNLFKRKICDSFFFIYFFLVFLVTLLSRSNGKPIHKNTHTCTYTERISRTWSVLFFSASQRWYAVF